METTNIQARGDNNVKAEDKQQKSEAKDADESNHSYSNISDTESNTDRSHHRSEAENKQKDETEDTNFDPRLEATEDELAMLSAEIEHSTKQWKKSIFVRNKLDQEREDYKLTVINLVRNARFQ